MERRGREQDGHRGAAPEQSDFKLSIAAASQYARDEADAGKRRLILAQRHLVVGTAGEKIANLTVEAPLRFGFELA